MKYVRGETQRFYREYSVRKKVTREVARYKSSRDRCPLGNHFRGHSVFSNGTKNLTTINFLSTCSEQTNLERIRNGEASNSKIDKRLATYTRQVM